MGAGEVESFLNYLAVERRVASATQSQALNAIVFLYDQVLAQSLGHMAGLKRVQHRHRVPVVLTREEVTSTIFPPPFTPPGRVSPLAFLDSSHAASGLCASDA